MTSMAGASEDDLALMEAFGMSVARPQRRQDGLSEHDGRGDGGHVGGEGRDRMLGDDRGRGGGRKAERRGAFAEHRGRGDDLREDHRRRGCEA